MANTTVIDQLIVKLGLDPSSFTKGEKEVASSALVTEKVVNKSTESMGGGFVSLAKKVVGVAGAMYLLKKAIGFIGEISGETRQLGFDSRNYGVAANGLRNLQNAAEMFGGKAEDVTRTVGGFRKAIFDLAFNGQVSDSLVMLGRLGVQFQNADGSARDFKDVLLDTAGALETSGLSKGNQFQALKQAGFDDGEANLALLGRAGAEAELKRQGERRQVNATDINAATRIEQSVTNRNQDLQAGGVATLDKVAGLAEGANGAADHLIKVLSGQESVSDALGTFKDAVTGATGALIGKTSGVTGAIAGAASDIAPGIFGTRGLRNNNPGNIRAVGDQARDSKGFRTFATPEEGISAANAQLDRYSKRGINTIAKIVSTWAPANENDTKGYIADVAKRTQLDPNKELDDGDRATILAAMFRHESGPGAPDSGAVADVLQPMLDGPLVAARGAVPTPGVQASAGGAGSETNVQIDQMTVNTRAVDADGVAQDMGGAIKRKFNASHAETGVN